MPGWIGPPHRSKRWHRKWLQHPLLNRQEAAVFWDGGLQCQRLDPPGELAAGPCSQDFRIRRARAMPFRTLSRCVSLTSSPIARITSAHRKGCCAKRNFGV